MVVPIVFSQEMNRYGIHIHLSEYYSGEAYVRNNESINLMINH